MSFKRNTKEKTAARTFTDDGKTYDVEKLWKVDKTPKKVSPDRFLKSTGRTWGHGDKKYGWKDVLENPKKYPKDAKAIREADLKYPILLRKGVVVDGIHRLVKAKQTGAPVRAISLSKRDMEGALTRVKAHDRKMPDGSVVRVEEHTRKRTKRKKEPAHGRKIPRGVFTSKYVVKQPYAYEWTNPYTGKKVTHKGIDVIPAGNNITVHSPIAGKVVSRGYEKGGLGHYIWISNDKTNLLLAHLAGPSPLKNYVRTGDVVGDMGSTGGVTGPHLHIEERVDINDPMTTVDPSRWLRSAKVEEHTRKRTKRKKEFALGIPRKNRFAEIPDKPGEWDYVVQDHHAIRAGRHYDLRLSDGRVAHSWALRHLPKPGEMTLAIQQPTHTIKYMRFEGVIPPGYGAGTVKRLGMGKVEVLESGPNKVVFNKYDGKRTNEYALIRTRSMLVPDKYGRHWLLINRSTVEGKYDYPRSKDSYKSMKYGDHLALEEGVMQPKVDGAHALIVLQTGKRPRVFSYRKSKRGDILEYTHKIPGLFKHKVPKGTGNVVLRAEIYLADKSGAALPAERTAGILNSGTLKAREAQKGTGGLRLIPFDIVTKRPMSYEKKLAKINALSDSMPYLGKPQAAVTKDEKLKMLRDVRAGKHPLSSEGVVIWRDTGAIKAKVTDDADVYVRSIFPGQGKHKGRAGGFAYSRTPDGPVVGRVGTGLSDGLREQLWENRDNLDGRVATVTYNKETSRGSLFAPRFMRWHVDKNLGEKLKTAARSVRVKGHSRKGKDGRVRRVKAHTRRYSASAVAHELGHVKRFSGPKGKTRLKRYTTGQRAAGAVMLGGFLSSPFMRYGSVTMRFTRIGIPLAYLGLSSPVLIEEYMASKEGLGALERTGLLTKEEHNKAKVTLGAAFSTYVLGAGMGAAAIPLFWQLRKRAGIPSLAFVLVPSLIGSVVAYNTAMRPGKKITADQVVKLQKELGTNTNIVALKKGTLGAYYIPPQKKTPSAATKKAIESVLDDPKQAESLYRDGGVLVPALGLTSGQRLKVTSDMTPEQRAKKLKQIRHYWKMKKGGGRG